LFAGVGLVILSPLFLLIAIGIKLTSPGPVIFRQRRVGLYGREFEIYKFRSMASDAEMRKADLLHLNEVKDGPIFKIAEDPRVTTLGRFLRRTSLDEFPQLINVLLGQMALVGPRPPLPSEVVQYSPEDWRRLTVLPGCTGLWQVSGRSDLGSFRTMVDLDLDYIDTWSHLLDLRIIRGTFRVVLRMEGSC
jgi:lipopolysaccharide/colanic/teichoic acid biosynthesis glycosyltransferase